MHTASRAHQGAGRHHLLCCKRVRNWFNLLFFTTERKHSLNKPKTSVIFLPALVDIVNANRRRTLCVCI